MPSETTVIEYEYLRSIYEQHPNTPDLYHGKRTPERLNSFEWVSRFYAEGKMTVHRHTTALKQRAAEQQASRGNDHD